MAVFTNINVHSTYFTNVLAKHDIIFMYIKTSSRFQGQFVNYVRRPRVWAKNFVTQRIFLIKI